MRVRSQTTPRRRGPKLPPPREPYNEAPQPDSPESPYYTIDNTEDIYGTVLSPSQRCYVDPWDLENYDYVRKKLNSPPPPTSPSPYYDTSLSPSPTGEPVATKYYYMPQPETHEDFAPRLAATMPRHRRRSSHFQCELECCAPAPLQRRRFDETRAQLYGAERDKYEDYMAYMTKHMQVEEEAEQNIYTGYGGFSSSSSTERHSSIGDDSVATLMLHSPGFGAVTRKRGVVLPKPAPKLDFPAPPPVSPTYDYCNPYATLPYCSVSDCYECLSQVQQNPSLIYAAPSMYGSASIYGGGVGGVGSVGGSSTLGRRPSSSLNDGIYGHKFGLSKKGLLQIDYSCSWNDLDRVIRRNY